MADLDPTGAPGGGDMMMDPMMGSGDADGKGSQEVFDMNAYRANMRKMDKIRSFMGIVSGCVAGICGLTGLAGLACFLILHITVSLSLLTFKMKLDLSSYSRESMLAFLTADLQKCAMSFMLFWTLFFGLVYLF